MATDGAEGGADRAPAYNHDTYLNALWEAQELAHTGRKRIERERRGNEYTVSHAAIDCMVTLAHIEAWATDALEAAGERGDLVAVANRLLALAAGMREWANQERRNGPQALALFTIRELLPAFVRIHKTAGEGVQAARRNSPRSRGAKSRRRR